MYSIITDPEKNRLIITMVGFLSKKEAESIAEEVMRETLKLKPGFDVINDISNFRMGLDETEIVLKETIDFLISKEVNKIIRIVGSSRAGILQFAKATGKRDKYNTQFVPTMEEAENYLKK